MTDEKTPDTAPHTAPHTAPDTAPESPSTPAAPASTPSPWWKRVLVGLVSALGIIFGILLFGRKKQGVVETPPRPTLAPVNVPDVNTAPSTTYGNQKVEPPSNPGEVVNGLNARYGSDEGGAGAGGSGTGGSQP